MLLDPPLERDHDFETSDSAQERALYARLWARVATRFPELAAGRARLETTGGDHLLLIMDDERVFRFPRAGTHNFELEAQVLQLLHGQSPVRTPLYDYVDPAGGFAGYDFVAGVALTPQRFDLVPAARREAILLAMASFLSELHGLTSRMADWRGTWPRTWTASDFADRALSERLPVIAKKMPSLAARAEEFFELYQRDRPHRLVVVHGDLVADHILLDPHKERISGIIDFGDVALGDPAQDFLGLWAYGDTAVSRVIELYRSDTNDPGLLTRSRNHFTRYRIDQLFENLSERGGVDLAREAEDVGLLLADATSKGNHLCH